MLAQYDDSAVRRHGERASSEKEGHLQKILLFPVRNVQAKDPRPELDGLMAEGRELFDLAAIPLEQWLGCLPKKLSLCITFSVFRMPS